VVTIAWLLGCTSPLEWGSSEEPIASEPAAADEAAEPAADVAAPDRDEPHLAASHVLVAFAGAVGADPKITRTEDEARAIASELHQQLVDGAALEALAEQYSDDPSRKRGGRIGPFAEEAVDPAFAEAIAEVEVGGITDPFRSPFGWHVARRDPCEVPRARHILVSFEGARASSETHNRAHARRMLDMLETRIQRGADFAELAAEYSNDTTADRGGDLGPVGDGQLLPVLEGAIDKLKPGQRTIVESPYGWHLVERTD